MERGSNKKGAKLDDQLEKEALSLETATPKDPHAESERQQETAGDEPGTGHRVAGSGSSADEYSYKDHGETGGASHPKPKDESERSPRVD
ncbi:MAG TPA: hypothetical protein VHJ34_12975 [Actinomycetota bacterium]|nr:hypothetical protein [Actinomycetota bacterium]